MTAFVERPGMNSEPSSYKCLRCQYPAVVFVRDIPYCADHRTDKPKTETPSDTSKFEAGPNTPKGGNTMTEKATEKTTKKAKETVPSTVAKTTTQTAAVIQPKVGDWVVKAKDGSDIRTGFSTKKEASAWALSQVSSGGLKAGQYKIIHLTSQAA